MSGKRLFLVVVFERLPMWALCADVSEQIECKCRVQAAQTLGTELFIGSPWCRTAKSSIETPGCRQLPKRAPAIGLSPGPIREEITCFLQCRLETVSSKLSGAVGDRSLMHHLTSRSMAPEPRLNLLSTFGYISLL